MTPGERVKVHLASLGLTGENVEGVYVGPCMSSAVPKQEVDFGLWTGRFPASWLMSVVPPLPPIDHIIMGRQGFVYTQWEDEEEGGTYFVQATEGSPRISWADMQRDAPFKRLVTLDYLEHS